MRILLALLWLCCFPLTHHAQDNAIPIEELTNQILKNPDNPLGIDKNYLLTLAQQIKDPQLSSLLQSYGNNLTVDEDISYRQMYYDIAEALEQHPELQANASYSQTAKKLDLLFNNYNTLSTKMQALNNSKYEFGMFVNDPNLITGLSGITGSYESALGVGLGVEFILSVTDIIAENQKFREDYIKLADISKSTIYAERDAHLPNALIDACLLITCNDAPINGNRITPLYRYDFSNGSSLRVEQGVLKYFSANGSSKSLLKVQKKNEGGFHTSTSNISMPVIFVSADEQYFYINKPSDALLETVADKKEEYLKNGGYVFNAENGEVLFNSTQLVRPLDGGEPLTFVNAIPKYYNIYRGTQVYSYTVEDKKINDRYKLFHGNSTIKDGFFTSTSSYTDHVIERTESVSCLKWNDPTGQENNSSFIIANTDKNGATNTDVMPNELCALTEDKQGNVYVVAVTGRLGKIMNADYEHTPMLTAKIRNALLPDRLVKPFNAVNDKLNYKSYHGSTSAINCYIPRLKLTPDDKYLVYTVADSLYIINPNNLKDIKQFGLSVTTHNFYFSKENGEWVLNILGSNDFKFGVHKKYSLEKLAKMNTRTTPQKQMATATPLQVKSTGNSSIAQEIKELNQLKNDGIITQEEFAAAKAKLLETSDNKGKTTEVTAPSNSATTTTIKKAEREISFTIDGVNYCAVNAPANSAFIGKYTYSGKEPCFSQNGLANNEPGAPIIQLYSTESMAPNGTQARNGIWQAHCAPAMDIWWWLESDCNANVKVEHLGKGDKYILVMQYKIGDKTYKKESFSRVSLDQWTDGSGKIVILGERIKQTP